jgi:hypothetical protein
MKALSRLLIFAGIMSIAIFTCSQKEEGFLYPSYKVKVFLDGQHENRYLNELALYSYDEEYKFNLSPVMDSLGNIKHWENSKVAEGDCQVILSNVFGSTYKIHFSLEQDTLFHIPLEAMPVYSLIHHKISELVSPPPAKPGRNGTITFLYPLDRYIYKPTGLKLLKEENIPDIDTVWVVYDEMDGYESKPEKLRILKQKDGSYRCDLWAPFNTFCLSSSGDQDIICDLIDFQNNCISLDVSKTYNSGIMSSTSYYRGRSCYMNSGDQVMHFSTLTAAYDSAYAKLKQNLGLMQPLNTQAGS